MAQMTHATTAVSPANGEAMAAMLAAGIGSFAMGLFVLANEAGVFSAPSLYSPSGGLSGRSTFAVIVWLIAWGLLHARWRGRDVTAAPVFLVTLVLIAAALVATFPPVWELVS